MTKFEYRKVAFKSGEYDAAMDEMGDSGWECYQVDWDADVLVVTAHFRRVKDSFMGFVKMPDAQAEENLRQ